VYFLKTKNVFLTACVIKVSSDAELADVSFGLIIHYFYLH